MARGRVERALVYGAGITGGPVVLFVAGWATGGTVGTNFAEEVLMLGPAVAMPASVTVAWLTGELLAGPTSRSWRPMIAAFLSAEVGFLVGVMLSWLVGHARPETVDATGAWDAFVQSVTLFIPFVVGGAAGSWAYRRWRYEVVSRGSAVENRDAAAS
jgi:hypothetical protein